MALSSLKRLSILCHRVPGVGLVPVPGSQKPLQIDQTSSQAGLWRSSFPEQCLLLSPQCISLTTGLWLCCPPFSFTTPLPCSPSCHSLWSRSVYFSKLHTSSLTARTPFPCLWSRSILLCASLVTSNRMPPETIPDQSWPVSVSCSLSHHPILKWTPSDNHPSPWLFLLPKF